MVRVRITHLICVVVMLLVASCKKEDTTPEEAMPGGATSVVDETSVAFEFPSANLSVDELSRHNLGDRAFEAVFVTAPSIVNSGLGPIFNQTSCVDCHQANGRAAFPTGTDLGGLLFRLSVPGAGIHGEPLPASGFGGQLQTKAIFGRQSEGSIDVQTIELIRQFIDGQSYTLREPHFSIINPYTTLPANLLMSPRIAPPIIGLGLIEAIAAQDIEALADEQDANGDGISGKPNYVWDLSSNQTKLGRFGWKAGQPSLFQQAAAAYSGDMGITSPLFSVENCVGQPQADGLVDEPEISSNTVMAAAFYTQSVAVPARRNLNDPDVLKGKTIFMDAGCASCHHPRFVTGTNPDVPSVSNQVIFPYTDLLLHDMGPGLADNRPEYLANGREWRTPPLWGIGLTYKVNGHTDFLHDGRARNIMEAILWHGGEGEASKEYVRALSALDRERLLAFLNSL